MKYALNDEDELDFERMLFCIIRIRGVYGASACLSCSSGVVCFAMPITASLYGLKESPRAWFGRLTTLVLLQFWHEKE